MKWRVKNELEDRFKLKIKKGLDVKCYECILM